MSNLFNSKKQSSVIPSLQPIYTTISCVISDHSVGGPYTSAVVLNNEIHILGGNDSSYYRSHIVIKSNGFYTESSLPYSIYSAVVYNGEIYCFYQTHFYKLTSTGYSSLTNIPFSFSAGGSAVVLNNEIHVIYSTNHYKWDGTNWSSVSTLPETISNRSAVVFNNEIHVFTNAQKHYKWDGTNWSSVSTLPVSNSQGTGSFVVFNDEIHFIIYSDQTNRHYAWNGVNWSTLNSVTAGMRAQGSILINFANILIVIGSNASATSNGLMIEFLY